MSAVLSRCNLRDGCPIHGIWESSMVIHQHSVYEVQHIQTTTGLSCIKSLKASCMWIKRGLQDRFSWLSPTGHYQESQKRMDEHITINHSPTSHSPFEVTCMDPTWINQRLNSVLLTASLTKCWFSEVTNLDQAFLECLNQRPSLMLCWGS